MNGSDKDAFFKHLDDVLTSLKLESTDTSDKAGTMLIHKDASSKVSSRKVLTRGCSLGKLPSLWDKYIYQSLQSSKLSPQNRSNLVEQQGQSPFINEEDTALKVYPRLPELDPSDQLKVQYLSSFDEDVYAQYHLAPTERSQPNESNINYFDDNKTLDKPLFNSYVNGQFEYLLSNESSPRLLPEEVYQSNHESSCSEHCFDENSHFEALNSSPLLSDHQRDPSIPSAAFSISNQDKFDDHADQHQGHISFIHTDGNKVAIGPEESKKCPFYEINDENNTTRSDSLPSSPELYASPRRPPGNPRLSNLNTLSRTNSSNSEYLDRASSIFLKNMDSILRIKNIKSSMDSNNPSTVGVDGDKKEINFMNTDDEKILSAESEKKTEIETNSTFTFDNECGRNTSNSRKLPFGRNATTMKSTKQNKSYSPRKKIKLCRVDASNNDVPHLGLPPAESPSISTLSSSLNQSYHGPVQKSSPKSIQSKPLQHYSVEEVAKTTLKFFTGVRILIIPSKINKTRLCLFKQRLEERGATVACSYSMDITHLVSELSGALILRELGVSQIPEHLTVVRSDWISESVMFGRLADVERHKVSFDIPNCSVTNAQEGPTSSTEAPSSNHTSKLSSKILWWKRRWRYKKRKYEPESDTDKEAGDSRDDGLDNNMQYSENGAIEVSSQEKSAILNEKPNTNSQPAESSQGQIIGVKLNTLVVSSEVTDSNQVVCDVRGSTQLGKKYNWEQKFLCMHSNTLEKGEKGCPNQYIINKLMVLKEAYESVNDKFRALGYTKAIAALKKYPKPITSKEEALQIPRVGKRLADKIGEIITSGHLQRLDYIGEDVQVMEMFTKVYGAGPYQAQVWYNQGFRTLEDLRTKAVLNRDQKIGLKYYDDLNQRMPREEVAKYAKVVMEAASAVDPKLQCYVAGSFRRLKPTCGDIDILITRDPSDGKSHHGLLAKIVNLLSERKFLTDDLALPTDETGSKYMGICRLNEGLHRHIDFLLVPYNHLGAALLYFTGSDIFNRSMRSLAIKKGMMLNMYGLYDQVLRGRKRKNLSEGRLIASSTEREIFERLGMPYREPHERNCE